MGPLPRGKEKAIYSVLRRYADLVFVEDGIVFICEAKMRPDPGAFAQLDLYSQLFPETPEFLEFSNYPIKRIFVTTTLDKALEKMAEEYDIEYIVFAPQWAKEYLETVLLREKRV